MQSDRAPWSLRAGLSGPKPLVVRDVTDLGEAYIACDPRDRSEVVVPIRAGNRVIGVLDLDSHQIGAFDEEDARLASELPEARRAERRLRRSPLASIPDSRYPHRFRDS